MLMVSGMMTRELEFFEYLGSLKHDLFLLQETHIQTEDIEAWSAEWGRGGGLASGILVARTAFLLICLTHHISYTLIFSVRMHPASRTGVGIVCNVSLDFEDLEGQERFSWSFDQCKTVLTRLEVSDLVYLCS